MFFCFKDIVKISRQSFGSFLYFIFYWKIYDFYWRKTVPYFLLQVFCLSPN